ncbi:MAG TPA: ribosome maturation factor RimM [Polyangiaceae bacterium]|nr:ribosome maturation factor RimM [Polyangiaceae bacterium]
MSAATSPSRLEIGRVAKPHGIGGAVKVALHWSGSEALEAGVRIRLLPVALPACDLTVEWARGSAKQLIVKFVGVSSRDAAEALRDAKIEMDRDALPPLAEGEYYLVDLLGAQVVGPEGAIGEVVEVLQHPTVDAVLVRAPDGKLYEQPLSAPWLRRVDAASKLIELENMDGLFA